MLPRVLQSSISIALLANSSINNMIYNSLALLTLAASASGKVYFKEDFNTPWESRWVIPSDWKTEVRFFVYNKA
jgi:hypothetical protein